MKYLERALDKQNQWWKYLAMLAASLVGANIIGAILIIIVILSSDVPFDVAHMSDLSYYGISQNTALLLMLFPFVLSLLAIALLLKPLHKRSLPETINGTKSIRWRRCLFAAAAWGLLMAVYLLIDLGIHPENYRFNFDPSSFIPLVLISVVFLPVQTTTEEVLFRGYLAQGIGAWTRRRWLAILIPGLLFGLMHAANPEIKAYGFWLAMPQYVYFGLFFGLISVLDDGIELAMGAHAANNVFASVFVTYQASAIQSPALFRELEVNVLKETLVMVSISIVFVAIAARKYKWRFAVLTEKIRENPQLPGSAQYLTDGVDAAGPVSAQ
jgi:membrane protease YdiL (CAAX protease family)